MLVLTRRSGESIVIGHDVVVTVLEVRGDVVRIGIDAPREVKVHRQEVFEEIAAATRAASVSGELASSFAASLRRSTTPDGQGASTTETRPSP